MERAVFVVTMETRFHLNSLWYSCNHRIQRFMSSELSIIFLRKYDAEFHLFLVQKTNVQTINISINILIYQVHEMSQFDVSCTPWFSSLESKNTTLSSCHASAFITGESLTARADGNLIFVSILHHYLVQTS